MTPDARAELIGSGADSPAARRYGGVTGNRFAAPVGMAHVVVVYRNSPLRVEDVIYTAQACGRERTDGTWEGWLEFLPDDGSTVLRSARETTQPSLAALEYWATGLTPVYLTGALERTLARPPVVRAEPLTPSVYDAPAPVAAPADPPTLGTPVLDPFSVYAKGEAILRRQLAALSDRHLRSIALAYDLADPSDIDLEALTAPELVDLITIAVRERLAA